MPKPVRRGSHASSYTYVSLTENPTIVNERYKESVEKYKVLGDLFAKARTAASPDIEERFKELEAAGARYFCPFSREASLTAIPRFLKNEARMT